MNKEITLQYYEALQQYAKNSYDPDLAIEIENTGLLAMLSQPEKTRSQTQALVHAIRGHIHTQQTAMEPESVRAWWVIDSQLDPLQKSIKKWKAVILVHGSVAYDAHEQKDFDIGVYIGRNSNSEVLEKQLYRALSDRAESQNIAIDSITKSIPEWHNRTKNINKLQVPNEAGSFYYETALITPLLYGVKVAGEESTLRKLQNNVMTTSKENFLVAATMVSALTAVLQKIQQRKTL